MQSLMWSFEVDPVKLCTQLPRLRFLSPIRNPLDHALSLQNYYRSGIPEFVQPYLINLELHQVFRFILKSHKYFFDQEKKCPSNFYSFTPQQFGPKVCESLANFLCVEMDHKWVTDALKVFEDRSTSAGKGKNEFLRVLNSEFSDDQKFVSLMYEASSCNRA